MPRALMLCSLAVLLFILPGGATAAKPSVKVNVLVIEAKRDKGRFDSRLEKIEKKIRRFGFKSAVVLDELNHKGIQIGSSVTLQMPSKKKDLRVELLEVTKKGKVKLDVSIKGMKFATQVSHPDGGMLLLIISKSDEDALMLGVTPTILK